VWTRRSYRQALTVHRELQAGAENFDAVRVYLWFRGLLGRLSNFRCSMRAYYRQLIMRALRRMKADKGPQADPTEHIRRQRTLSRQLGEAAPVLAPVTEAITNDEMIAAYDAARFGAEDAMRAHKGEALMFARIFETWGIPNWIIAALEPQTSLIHLFSGLAQYPENGDTQIAGSADETMLHAHSETLNNVRDLMQVFPWVLRHIPKCLAAVAPENNERLQRLENPFAAVAESAKRNPWRLVIFVMLVTWLKTIKDHGWHLARAVRTVIPPLQRMIAYCEHDPRIAALLNDANPWTFPIQLLSDPIERISGGKAMLVRADKNAMFRASRLLWPHGLGELRRMHRRQRAKPCLTL
jgi:hypothetical protein